MLKEKLNPEYSNQKSFYGKAIVLRSNDELQLQSYKRICKAILQRFRNQ